MPFRKRTKKILYLVNNDWFFLSHRLQLARSASDAGYKIVVATRVNNETDAKIIIKEGFRLYPLRQFAGDNINPLREMAAVLEIAAIYLKEKPTLAHHIGLKAALTGSIAARFTGVPAIVNTFTGLGYLFTRDDSKARVIQKIVLLLIKLAVYRKNVNFIFQNRDDQAKLLSGKVVKSSQASLILGSGVDIDDFAFSKEPEGTPKIVFASRILWNKGIAVLVEAVRLLRQRGLSFEAAIVGKPDPGNPQAVPEEQLRLWHEGGDIEWWGYQENMPGIIKNSNIICLPTFYGEGLPKILLEASACGRAIVTTNIAGCRDIVKDGVNGLLVPPENAVKLADALQTLIENPGTREKMGRNGREIVTSGFTLQEVNRKTLSVYENLLKE
ncbi:MAG: glycosyltransferase family 4 protein [Candidatus Electryonea clarkiae]|nr:glycosyltransferase family 4 protein [Candidatus Electryonea clarkiae]MDP8285460.1 glycosyltransferase family 4 protein [Candidatus Electryonea clarkiae]